MSKPVETLADIAALAGVTPATVSRALADSPRISEKTRVRIRSLAEQHGFHINQTARNLRMGRTRSIACVIPLGHESAQRVSDPFYTALIGNLMDGLAQREHNMLLSAVAPADENWLTSICRGGSVDGVIVLCQSNQEAVLERVGEHYQPLVVWGEASAQSNYCCVGTDNMLGGKLATKHLLDQGRRRIAFAGMHDIPELSARWSGYLSAHRDHGVEPGPHIPVPLALDQASPVLAEMLAEMLSDEVALDAIFAASDVIAMSLLRALQQLGRRVPEDVAVVGYDDVSLAAYSFPPLTTVRQDLKLAAETLLDCLFARMEGEPAETVKIPLSLIRRASA
ncbi:LacI family DNA-binding transcriptional regulator [Stakelama pacifica]|uniref:LacI family transcriptional regulator n=1 Tax=Stakelama pacifica TaxID=517720 RepID=A0A4R6FYH5_9SPHN|nr:LacI family DNA-binding transcriptional regulator [Stakelama pacifica]TDN87021.1 LacI family transcriptional regulator [Stakelama pacifica]GGO91370.1 LacI family transcriptional regulator [Stakelama pacifica]